jgi:hypothetical protein
MLFISYSRKDAEIAEHFAHTWRASGQQVFIDKQSLDYGEDWQRQIAEAIASADRLILFWSQPAVESAHVTAEWRQALATPTCKIVPYILDDTPLPTELQHLHGVTGFDRIVRFARSKDWVEAWLSKLTKVAFILLLIAIPVWLFIAFGGQQDTTPYWHTFLFGKKPSTFRTCVTLVFQMLSAPASNPAALLLVLGTPILSWLITRCLEMLLRQEIMKNAIDTPMDSSTSNVAVDATGRGTILAADSSEPHADIATSTAPREPLQSECSASSTPPPTP